VAIGFPHHVTQCGNNRADVFFHDQDREHYLRTLVRYCAEFKLQVWAYCLMTNHVHLLVVPEREYSLAQGIGRTNLIYTQYVNREYRRSGRVWQNRFFSCPVDRDEYLWTACRYIERNPVRARLVVKPWDFQWSSARHHVLGTPDPALSPSQWPASESREQYREYLDQVEPENDTTRIRTSTQTGRPLGSPSFIERLEIKLGRILRPQKAGRKKRT
jgi:putative transposase